MKLRKTIKKLVRRFLPQTLCVKLKGNLFRENDILSADPSKGNLLILRKELCKEGLGIVSHLYCIRYKPGKNKKWNKRRVRFYKWLAYKNLIC